MTLRIETLAAIQLLKLLKPSNQACSLSTQRAYSFIWYLRVVHVLLQSDSYKAIEVETTFQSYLLGGIHKIRVPNFTNLPRYYLNDLNLPIGGG